MPHNRSTDEGREKSGKGFNEEEKAEKSVQESVGNTIERHKTHSGPADELEDESDEQNEQSESALRLRDHLEGLPQELYHYIYDLTFTAGRKRCIYVPWTFTGKYDRGPGMLSINEKLPHLLHVDRRSRKKFARMYFGDPKSILVIHGGAIRNVHIESQHLELIPELVFIRGGRSWDDAYDDRARQDMVAHGFGAAVVEKFEFMSPTEFVARYKDQARRVRKAKARRKSRQSLPHAVVDGP
ncbi:hypothetical protein CBER1_10122 [Cercospora berteroae]|uniref:Uncharacterized protein n=1 Tax=Cercospora berteroae TaxID=357750 RepID=A0A2S6CKF7_9PEZI|nr:hypothetical protein CBER1_10122 [Cercospora berteroae]